MDPRRAGRGERTRLRDRVVAVHRLFGVVALVETHALAGAQVDCRKQLHQVLAAAT